MLMRFKGRNLQRRIWNCIKPYDGSFSKIEEIEIWRINISKGVNVFQNTRLKILEFSDRMMEGGKMEWLFVFKIKQEMCVVTPNW